MTTDPTVLPAITGASRLFAIVGDPIEQVRSPEVFGRLFAARGLDAVMVPMRVAPDAFETALAGMGVIANLDGIVVTLPHKFAAARLASRLGPVAALAGSANALRRSPAGGWDGEMFDGIGFVQALYATGVPPRDKRILVIGAGGVGSAIAAALMGEAPRGIALFDIAEARSRDLVDRLRQGAPEVDVGARADADPAGFEIVVNATPLGMRADDPLPIDPERLDRDALVADVIMKPPVTRLLEAAAGRACRTLEGQRMLDHQAPLIAQFFGIDSPGRP